MSRSITVDTRDGSFQAYVARPERLPAPAVVVLQEIFGVNADLRENCDELATQGYLALSPTRQQCAHVEPGGIRCGWLQLPQPLGADRPLPHFCPMRLGARRWTCTTSWVIQSGWRG